jgi:hypothetical protein
MQDLTRNFDKRERAAMKRILAFAIASGLVAHSAHADLITLGTSNPVGSPLAMSAGSTSGPMLVNILNNKDPDSSDDLMNAWQITLVIGADLGATGTLTFNTPSGNGPASNPPNYVFSAGNIGIDVKAYTGSGFEADDFPLTPTQVPTLPKNLMQVDFLASASASGLFGIFARQGDANTLWTNNAPSPPTTRFFTNVPNGNGLVRIGEVLVSGPAVSVVPEPGSLTLFVIGGFATLGYCRRRIIAR